MLQKSSKRLDSQRPCLVRSLGESWLLCDGMHCISRLNRRRTSDRGLLCVADLLMSSKTYRSCSLDPRGPLGLVIVNISNEIPNARPACVSTARGSG